MAYAIKQTPLFKGKSDEKLARWFSGEKNSKVFSFDGDITKRTLLSTKEECKNIIMAISPLTKHKYTIVEV